MPNAAVAKWVRDRILALPENYRAGAGLEGPQTHLGPGEELAGGETRLGVAGWAALGGGYILHRRQPGQTDQEDAPTVVAEGEEDGLILSVLRAGAAALQLPTGQADALFRADLSALLVLTALHQLAHGADRIDWTAALEDSPDPILQNLLTASPWTHHQLTSNGTEPRTSAGPVSSYQQLTAGTRLRVAYSATVKHNYGSNVHLDNGTDLPPEETLEHLTVLAPGWQPGDTAHYPGLGNLFRTLDEGQAVWMNSKGRVIWDDTIDPHDLVPVALGTGPRA